MSTVLVQCFVLSFRFHNVVTYSKLGSVFKEIMLLVTSLFRHVTPITSDIIPTRSLIVRTNQLSKTENSSTPILGIYIFCKKKLDPRSQGMVCTKHQSNDVLVAFLTRNLHSPTFTCAPRLGCMMSASILPSHFFPLGQRSCQFA